MVIFCPDRDIMSVEKSFLPLPCPVRDKMFSSSHYIPDGTGDEGAVFFYRYNVPDGTENNIFQTGFFKKKRILHFCIPLAWIAGCNIR